jgi:group I intron endonuclease
MITLYSAYKATNTINGKGYIGITKYSIKRRRKEHFTAARRGRLPLHKAIRKYGNEYFTFEHIASAKTEADILAVEVILIKQERTQVPHGYNVTAGGKGLLNPSADTRAKMSDSHVRYSASDEGRLQLSRSAQTRYATPLGQQQLQAFLEAGHNANRGIKYGPQRLAQIRTSRKKYAESDRGKANLKRAREISYLPESNAKRIQSLRSTLDAEGGCINLQVAARKRCSTSKGLEQLQFAREARWERYRKERNQTS